MTIHPDLEGVPSDVVDRFGLDRLPFDQRERSLLELIELKGKRAVVTGGGGESLGQAICWRLAELGASVAVLGTTASRTEKVARRIVEAGGTAVSIEADVTDWDGIHAAMDTVAREFGGIDILVNNAGGALRTHGAFTELSKADIDRVIAVNFNGLLYTIRAALAHMLPAGSGRIINIASEGGKSGMRNLVHYNSSKSGALGVTRNLARELSGTGVSVVSVCPGIMVGPYTLQRFKSYDGRAGVAALTDAMQRVSLGRVSLPEEVANMVAFLATPAGSYVQGTAVSVGGGQSDW
jgi:NAD(P)-dependent dehydrogenase (short-subunit alcohol dehydrogenase family)